MEPTAARTIAPRFVAGRWLPIRVRQEPYHRSMGEPDCLVKADSDLLIDPWISTPVGRPGPDVVGDGKRMIPGVSEERAGGVPPGPGAAEDSP